MAEIIQSKNLRYSILITSLLLALGAFITVVVSIFLYALDYNTIGKILLTFSIVLSIFVLVFCWIYLYVSGRLQGYLTNGGYPIVFGDFVHLEARQQSETTLSFSGKEDLPPKYDTLQTMGVDTSTELPSYNELCTKDEQLDL